MLRLQHRRRFANATQIKKLPLKLVEQGTYGCIFRPAIPCKSSNKPTNSQYISKIQPKTGVLIKNSI